MRKDSFAYYRLPYADHYRVVSSEREPLVLGGGAQAVGACEGFVIAPFDGGEVVVIRPDSVSRHTITSVNVPATEALHEHEAVSEQYARTFARFHDAVASGCFTKLVLARAQKMTMNRDVDPEQLFLKACAMYPRLMIMLFHTPITGTWLVASPEILVEGRGTTFHTIALAGTMPWQGNHTQWSAKNRGEQHVVEQYIGNQLERHCRNIIVDGPVTVRAGNLMHLRSDFHFQLKEGHSLGMLVDDLHPTPAVCGMPKAEARQFIDANEELDRRCYSGYAGPVGIDGETHLYVLLRCAQLDGHRCTLYAGGGIMPDSDCEQEWRETESKMKTIKNVLR